MPLTTWPEKIQLVTASSWSPRSLSGLVLWLDATRLGQADTTPVSAWYDQSGQGNHALQGTVAAQPTYRAVGINGRPSVVFDGVDDMLTIATGATYWPTWTVIAVVFYSAPATSQYPIFSNRAYSPTPAAGSGQTSLYVGNGGTSNVFAYMGEVAVPGLSGTSVITGGVIVSLVVDSVHRTLYYNGSQEAQDTNVAATILPWGALGWDHLPNWYPYAIGAVVMYGRALGAGELRQLTRWLGRKWGINVG